MGRGLPSLRMLRLGWSRWCLCGASPVLIDRVCQLVGLLINTSRACWRDEIFFASGFEHVEVVLARLSSGGGGGELESYASFVQRGADAVGVFTFDGEQRPRGGV